MESIKQMEQTIESPKVVNFVKGLIIAIGTTFATIIGKNGYPETTVGWEFLGITVLASLLSYIAINGIAPSTTPKGQINWSDIIKGTLLAICAALGSLGASKLTGTAADGQFLFKLMSSIAIGYVIKNYASSKGVPTFALGLLPASLKTDIKAADDAVKEEKPIAAQKPIAAPEQPLNN
jgi:hypothetical protein